MDRHPGFAVVSFYTIPFHLNTDERVLFLIVLCSLILWSTISPSTYCKQSIKKGQV